MYLYRKYCFIHFNHDSFSSPTAGGSAAGHLPNDRHYCNRKSKPQFSIRSLSLGQSLPPERRAPVHFRWDAFASGGSPPAQHAGAGCSHVLGALVRRILIGNCFYPKFIKLISINFGYNFCRFSSRVDFLMKPAIP